MTRAGWRLTGYRIEEFLGAGASGEVWRARVRATGVPVALKRVWVGSAEQRAQAVSEAAILATLDHPHLMRLHELRRVDRDGALVLVLDLAAGGSLAGLLARRGRLTVGEVVTALAPVGSALASVHQAGVVHGDVSCANVLFTAAGLPLLADLGVARLAGRPAPVRTTPAYADPAVAAGGIPGPDSDVFMLGGVALHALTGSPPWPGRDSDAVFEAARSGAPPDFEQRLAAAGTPDEVGRVVARALSLEPARRGTAADFALELRHAARPVAVELTAGRGRIPPAGPRHLRVRAGQADPSEGEPCGAAPCGAVPSGAVPSGAVPSGAVSSGAVSSGAVPSGAVPSGADGSARPECRRGGPVEPAPQPPFTAGARPPAPFAPRHQAARRRRSRAVLVVAAAAAAVLTVALAAGVVVRRHGAVAARGSVARPASSPRAAAGARPAATAVAPAAGPRTQDSAGPGRDRPAAGPLPGSPAPAAATGAARPAGPPAPSATGPEPARARDALDALDRRRARAYALRRPDLLAAVYAAPALLSGDRRQLAAIVPPGCGLRGVRTAFAVLDVQARDPTHLVLVLRSRLTASVLVCAGVVSGRAAAGRPERVEVVLLRGAAGYRIAARHRA